MRLLKRTWKQQRNQDYHSFKMYCVHLLFRLTAHNIVFFTRYSRAKRYQFHPDNAVTLCPHRAKRKLHPSVAITSVTALQRRLSGTSSSVLITTAICTTYANILYKPALSLVRLFSLKSLLQTIKPRQVAIFVLSRIVIECSSQHRVFRPRYYPVVAGHTSLTCASLRLIICL